MCKKYMFRVEEPATAGPSWDHKSTAWNPILDGPVMPEMSLLPVWLQVWRWMCGAIDEDAETFNVITHAICFSRTAGLLQKRR